MPGGCIRHLLYSIENRDYFSSLFFKVALTYITVLNATIAAQIGIAAVLPLAQLRPRMAPQIPAT